MNIDHLDRLDPYKYPDISVLIKRLQEWNRKAESNSVGAGTFAVLYDQLRPSIKNFQIQKFFHLLL